VSPESIDTELVGSDPLAELLRPDEVLRPREVYRSALRTDLMHRPPVAPALWQRLLPGVGPVVPVIVLLLVMSGLTGLVLRGRGPATAESPPTAATAASTNNVSSDDQPGTNPGGIEDDLREIPVANPERSEAAVEDDPPNEVEDEAPAPSGAASHSASTGQELEEAKPATAAPPTRAPERPADENTKKQAPAPSLTPPPASPTPTLEPEPTGIVFEDPTPGPSETPPVSAGRATSQPPTPTTNP